MALKSKTFQIGPFGQGIITQLAVELGKELFAEVLRPTLRICWEKYYYKPKTLNFDDAIAAQAFASWVLGISQFDRQ